LLEINYFIEFLSFSCTQEILNEIENSTLKRILEDDKIYKTSNTPANIKKFFIYLCAVYILYLYGFFANKSRIFEKIDFIHKILKLIIEI
jgi:hypothetical protein